MTYFPDLSPCLYFDRIPGPIWSTKLVAVGWLEPGHTFRRGAVDRGVREKLAVLLQDPWELGRSLGSHTCEYCVDAAERVALDSKVSRPYARGSRNVFVPGERVVYVAPALVTHYIDEHDYLPPHEFCEAVEACPPMRSKAYYAQVRFHLSRAFDGPKLSERLAATARQMSARRPVRKELKKYLRDISAYPPIASDDALALARRARAGDACALDRLVRSHLQLVVQIAKEYKGRGLRFVELIADGNLGLLRAAHKFHEGDKSDFTSYAVGWIRNTIAQRLAEQAELDKLQLRWRHPFGWP